MEARKRFMSIDLTKLPDPPRPSYTFTLFSRDLFEKSKYKNYDSLLKSKLSRSQARVSHLASIFGNGNSIGANGNLTSKSADVKVPETTSTHYINGEYVASFTIGGEQIKSYLLIDTGSDLIWWQCKPCTEGDVTIKMILYIMKSTGACVYDVTYADKSRTRGWIAEDVITFVLDQNQKRILFGCGKDQTSGDASFSHEYAGIAGLGRRVLTGGYSLPSQFLADIMSMCLPGLYSGSATISFHTTPFDQRISAEILPNPAYPYLYFINLYKLFINNKEIPLNPSIRNFRNDIDGGRVVDTGTILTTFPRDLYNVFRDTFRKKVQDFPLVDDPTGGSDTCYKVDPGVSPHFPNVLMYFSNEDLDNVLIPSQQRVVFLVRGLFCLALVRGMNASQL
ncbi:protein ASPARTIC PROTEASE IN GUARD CELL 1-like [Capsicum annuum]|uniref:protein ASPARTIC PROTEASE IN GUARD CELL 1-like n=1 Tax=Capsicum annuum TaxID=4072 RepID=UPI001FB0A2BF|nr:protein ASPARTIC PROTEASE IN GUARD CELL 1-like [Capsicum annuum]